MSGTKKVVGAVVLAAALTAATACSAAAPKATPEPAPPRTPVASASAATVQAVYDTSRAPQLPLPGRVLLQAAGRTGGEQFPVVPHIAAGALMLGVVCVGPGKLTVAVGHLFSTTFDCHGPDAAEDDEFVLDQPLSNVAVSVTDGGNGGDRWALTLGRNDSTTKPPE